MVFLLETWINFSFIFLLLLSNKRKTLEISKMTYSLSDVTAKLLPKGATASKATSDASGNVITSTYATKTEDSAKVVKSGSRGTLAGYNTPASSSTAITISNTSNDDTIVTTAVNVTVNNGSSGQTWTKTVALQNASATVTLGGSWKWMNGEAPTVSANSILVLKWCGTFGIANLVVGG